MTGNGRFADAMAACAFVAILALYGCGQKGDLYLPAAAGGAARPTVAEAGQASRPTPLPTPRPTPRQR